MNEYERLRAQLRERVQGPDGSLVPRPTSEILDALLVALARDRAADEITRAAAEIDRLARDGTSCLVVGAEPPAQAMESLVALGWSWVPLRSEMVRDGAMSIRVAWTSSAIRGPNFGALWLVGATQAMATEARRGLRRPPGVTITTGMTDQSDPAGVDPVIRDTDKTDPPSDPEPVLPPGCRLSVVPEGWVFVLGHHGVLPLPITSDQGEAVRNVWKVFESFMSREDYEALAERSERCQRIEVANASLLVALDQARADANDRDAALDQEILHLAWAERDRAVVRAEQAERRADDLELDAADAKVERMRALSARDESFALAHAALDEIQGGGVGTRDTHYLVDRCKMAARFVASLRESIDTAHAALDKIEGVGTKHRFSIAWRCELAAKLVASQVGAKMAVEMGAQVKACRDQRDALDAEVARLRGVLMDTPTATLADVERLRTEVQDVHAARLTLARTVDAAKAALRRAGIDGTDLAERIDALAEERDERARWWAAAVGERDAARAEAAHVAGLADRVRLLASNWTAAREEAARTAGERDEARAERDKAWATAKRAAAMLPPIKIIRSPEPGVRERVEFPDGSVCVERETPNTLSWEVTPPYPAESLASEWSHERRRRWDQALAVVTQSRDRVPAMLLGPEVDHD